MGLYKMCPSGRMWCTVFILIRGRPDWPWLTLLSHRTLPMARRHRWSCTESRWVSSTLRASLALIKNIANCRTVHSFLLTKSFVVLYYVVYYVTEFCKSLERREANAVSLAADQKWPAMEVKKVFSHDFVLLNQNSVEIWNTGITVNNATTGIPSKCWTRGWIRTTRR